MRIKRGKSCVVFSAKGGVGKTTNVLNIAGMIEQLEKRVIIIDFDLYTGSIATYLDKQYDKSIYHLYNDMFNNSYEYLDNYVTRVDDYIDIIPAPRDPRDANKIDINYINKIIDEATLKYDMVLIDTNHALNDINLTILSLVDNILFMTTNDPLDLSNLKSLLSIFNSLELKNYKVLLNNSIDPNKNYFSLYDIRHILKHNIDYSLSKNLYLKDMNRYIMNGIIISLDRKFASLMPEDYQCLLSLSLYLLGGDKNEE